MLIIVRSPISESQWMVKDFMDLREITLIKIKPSTSSFILNKIKVDFIQNGK